MKIKRKTHPPDLGVDMTPMIDCVFLLLIFFMCTSSMSKVDQTPEIRLPIAPKAAVPDDLRGRGTVNLLPLNALTGAGETVTREKPFLVSGRLVDDAELQKQIAARRQEEPNLRVYLRVDREVDFAQVRRAIKACAEAGVFDVIFATFQSEAGG